MRDEKFATCTGMVVSIVVLAVIGAFANGWALSTIWNWFMPPIFGLVGLTLWQAVGVSMVFSMFTGTKTSIDNSKTKDKTFGEVFLESLILAILNPAITVAFAYIIYQIAF